MVPLRRTVRSVVALAMLASATCSSGDGDGEGDAVGDAASNAPTDTTTASTAPDRPDGPAATFEPLAGGAGISLAATSTAELEAVGWVEEEYAAFGTAVSYRSAGALPADGHYELTEDASADYRTRIVVRRPADDAEFNGTVVLEWLNVSGGLDASPDWTYMSDELIRGGYAWVGVSAQLIGVEGGESAVQVEIEAAEGLTGLGLRGVDPERYGSLSHPGDAFAYDIFTQVGRALRDEGSEGSEGSSEALGGLAVERILAVGESQSGIALTTYVNGVQPLTGAFDGSSSTAGGRRRCHSASRAKGCRSPTPSPCSRPRSEPTSPFPSSCSRPRPTWSGS